MTEFFVYAGLAGDTDPGRFWSAGLFRSARGGGKWESLADRFPEPPHVFSILVDSVRPNQVTVGTHDGIWRSDDRGMSWRSLSARAPGLGVWSLTRHPSLPDTIFAGYEPCAVLRSDNDGEPWQELDLRPSYPAVSDNPDIPKRVISIAVDPSNTDDIYASVEVGGLLRSPDSGQTWKNIIDGLYIDEGFVDVHSVMVNPKRPGQLTIATRFGTFRSDDRGDHWRDLKAPLMRPIGSYCRCLRYAPGDGDTLYLGAANDFDGDRGALFISRDNGVSWQKADPGTLLKTPIFGLAVDPNRPDNVMYSTKIGQLIYSTDKGRNFSSNPLPHGSGHVFALAAG